MTKIMKTLFVSIASLSLLISAAKAGELTVSGTAKATYLVVNGAQDDNGIGVTNELNFTASGEMDNGYSWSYSMELDPNTTGDTATSPSNTPPGAALNDDTQISLKMNDLGTVKMCVSECSNGKEYAADQSVYTSMTDTGYSEGIVYPASESSYASLQYHSPELPFGTTGSIAYGQKKADGQSGNTTGQDTGAGNGANGNSISAYSLVSKPVDGVTLHAMYYDINDYDDGLTNETQLEEGGAYAVEYASGNLSLGYGKSFKAPETTAAVTAGATTVEYYENTLMSLAYAVNDALSVSYTREEGERNFQTSATVAYDIEVDSIQVAYSLGGATLSIARADYENVGYANGVDATDTIIAMTFAF